jgi:SAM-dependent methyltransferase
MSVDALHGKINTYRGPYHWFLPSFFAELHVAPLDVVAAHLAPDAVVVDLGAGDGRLTHLLSLRFRRVIGLDHQHAALRLAQMMTALNGTAPGLSAADAARLPLATASVDGIVAFEIIEHLPPEIVPAFLQESQRVLRGGGWLFVSTPNRASLRNRLLGHRLDEKHYFEATVQELTRLVAVPGFSVEVVEGYYVAPPLRRIEHFASTVPFRPLFRRLIRLGHFMPGLSERILVGARKQ